MATIKSYTDLEQSKKLAEILPLDSADCFWDYDEMQKFHRISWFEDGYNKESQLMLNENNVCAWSLAALIGVMSQINEWFTPYGHKNEILYQFEPKICKIWEHNFIPSYKVTYGNRLFTDSYDNPIDACVTMIEKLHELNCCDHGKVL